MTWVQKNESLSPSQSLCQRTTPGENVSRDLTGPEVIKGRWGPKGGAALFQRKNVSLETQEVREWSLHIHTPKERESTQVGGISKPEIKFHTLVLIFKLL